MIRTKTHVTFRLSYKASIIASLPSSFSLVTISAIPMRNLGATESTQTAKPLASTMQEDNPFFKPSSLLYSAPDFAKIQPSHFLPAFEAGMQEQLAEVKAIAEQKDAPNFDNTLIPLEKSGSILRRVASIFFNLSSADSNDEIQKIEEQIAPRLAGHSDDIYLNKELFQRVESLWNRRDTLQLNEEQGRLLKEQYEAFVRAGAKLSETEQQDVRRINEELSSLTTQFQNNLLALGKERAVIVDSKELLDGLSDAEIETAAADASAKGHPGKFLLGITNTTRQPVLSQLKNRALRERVWRASAERGLGQNGGLDNQPLVLKMASLRAKRAALLGYPSHAAYTLENQMAGSPQAAMKMLEELAPQVVARASEEAADIARLMKAEGVDGPVQPWDWEFYAEKVRQEKYAFDENQLKPYFEIDRVLKDGVFFTMNKLYGISFEERHDMPVYHPTVRVFNVYDQDGKQIALFYADYYQRDSKRGGAWMDAYVSQSRLLDQMPVIVNVMNIPKPVEGQPTLVSLDHVTTMFHELGHGVHGMFSSVEYPTLSGTNVPRDFVEFPSTFHEDWAIDPIVLGNYAKHYQTGEVIPADLLNKAIAANKFNKGYDTLEYLSAALLDLSWHALKPDEVPADVQKFESETLKRFHVDVAAIPPRYRTAYFAHVWSGGYSAGYYAYLWSEVLAADAFAYMREKGGLTKENGQSYRDCILSKGGTREVMSQYIDFRGSEPKIDGLLMRRGLK